MYGPLLIGSILTMLNSFSSWAIIFSNCSSVISKPAPINNSPFLSLISFAIYFPTIWSLGIEIFSKPFSFSFLAITIFNFSPFPKTFLLFFASIKSYESLIGRLKLSKLNSVDQLLASLLYKYLFVE